MDLNFKKTKTTINFTSAYDKKLSIVKLGGGENEFKMHNEGKMTA
jgi:hypothetical protein